MKKYDIERIIEKVEKYKDMDLNNVNPDNIPDTNEIKIEGKRKRNEY